MNLATLLVCSLIIALLSMAIAFAVYIVLKNANVENPTAFATVAGISMPISAIALLFLEYLQFLTGYLSLVGQVP